MGTGHTFSNTGASNFCSIFVASFSGAATTSPFDQQNGATATGVSTISTGSVTPTNNNELVITQLGFNSAGLPTSIDNGFTKTNDVEFGAANNYGGSMAYKIQTTATAVNPSWTRTGTLAQTAVIATFNVAITTIRNSNVLLMGVG